MTKKTRTILFFILLILFLLIAPAAIFYSQGYRINFETKKLTQTGAFYFKVSPKSVQIHLDGKLEKKTDFFFGSALIENLLPKKYKVEIKKDGFYPWKKYLEIKEKEVTGAKNIVLVPENPNFIILTNKVENFFFSPDEKKIILKEVNKNGWALKLFELEGNIKSHLIEKVGISKENVEFFNLTWSPDSKRILLKTATQEQLKNFVLEINQIPISSISLDYLGSDVNEISFNPQESQKIFFTKLIKTREGGLANNLFEANYTTKEISQPILSNLLSYEIFKKNIFWLSEDGYLLKGDFSGRNQEQLNLEPLPLKKEVEHKIAVFLPYIFLKEGDILYFFDESTKSFKKIFEPIKNFRFSPDFKKIVYFNNYEIGILFLEFEYGQPQKSAGEQLFLTRFSEKIGEVFWLTSHYLIFNVGDKIKIAEIDERDRINIYDLAEFKNLEIFFNQKDKKLYTLSEGNLFVSKELLP